MLARHLLCLFVSIQFTLQSQVFSLADVTAPLKSPEVFIQNGKLRGKWQTARPKGSNPGRTYAAFLGVPYAKPPKRFQPPEPAVNWNGVRDATFTRSMCPQNVGSSGQAGYPMSEDCLFANIYTPQVYKQGLKLLPVLFYIHGGSFYSGSGAFFDGRYFEAEDVVLVIINYRLGAFGFLNMGDDQSCGNMGLKDMIEALKWVQRNIRAFGGDPNNVMVFGNSAGGTSAHALLISPAAKGLFHKVIVQSGSTLCPWAFNRKPEEQAWRLAKAVNCIHESSQKRIECLRSKTMEEILAVEVDSLVFMGILSPFVLTVETHTCGYKVLPDYPENLIANPEQNNMKIPFIIGWNEIEGMTFAGLMIRPPAPTPIELLNSDFYHQLPRFFEYTESFNNTEDFNKFSDKFIKFYCNMEQDKLFTVEHVKCLSAALTDHFFARDIKRTAILHAKYNQQVYPYLLTYDGMGSVINAAGFPSQGAAHQDDLQYLLNNVNKPMEWKDINRTSVDMDFSLKMISFWTSMAKDGKPSAPQSEIWNPIPLVPVDSSRLLTMPLKWYNLDAYSRHESEDLSLVARFEFWEKNFPRNHSSQFVDDVGS